MTNGQDMVNPEFEVNEMTGSINGQMQDYTKLKIPLHMPAYLQGFLMDVDRMNSMYRMPLVEKSFNGMSTRIEQFKSILTEEIKELDDAIDHLNIADDVSASYVMMEFEVSVADLLGDIIVYCASEAKRWNIPIDRVLSIIMQSNFSKLDSNGQPIYDERMKLMKGPNYWKPEPKIAKLLESHNSVKDGGHAR